MVGNFDKNSEEIRTSLAKALQKLEGDKIFKKQGFLNDPELSIDRPFFWPGDDDDFNIVFKNCHIFNSKEDLIAAYFFSKEFVDSTQNWTYSLIVGSCFFKFLESFFLQVKAESGFSGKKNRNFGLWSLVCLYKIYLR